MVCKVAYDGSAYQGSQRQPHRNTVEDVMLAAMADLGMATDAASARFGAAARTDAGVHAAANLFAFDTAFAAKAVVPALASRLRGVWPWAWALVDDAFDARRWATHRTYVYVHPPGRDLSAARAAFAAFVGTHDWSAFAKHDASVPDRTRRVHRADVTAVGPLWRFEVTADAFVWQQVRRMVGAALDAGDGMIDVAEIEARLASGTGTPLRIAPPEGLVLADVGLPASAATWHVNKDVQAAAVAGLADIARFATVRASSMSTIGDVIAGDARR